MGILSRFKKPGGMKKLVEILEGSDEKTKNQMIEQMKDEDAAYSARVLPKVLSWADCFELEQPSMQILFQFVPLKVVATAITELQSNHMEVLKAQLNPKLWARILEECEIVGSPTHAVINTSRRKIVASARELEASGKVKLPLSKRVNPED